MRSWHAEATPNMPVHGMSFLCMQEEKFCFDVRKEKKKYFSVKTTLSKWKTVKSFSSPEVYISK